MSDAPSMPEGLPPGAIHLGTFTAVRPGQFVSRVLKLSNDPEADLLDTANSFRMAADRCLTSCKVVPGVEMLTVPGAVCAALACELYLKFIHLKESGHFPHGHDLVELFTGLGESTCAALAELRSDIEQVLQRNRSHFTGARSVKKSLSSRSGSRSFCNWPGAYPPGCKLGTKARPALRQRAPNHAFLLPDRPPATLAASLTALPLGGRSIGSLVLLSRISRMFRVCSRHEQNFPHP